jgi:spore coat protein U-like protein
MFKKSALKISVAAALLGISGFALAAGGTANLTVNAKILGVCKVTSGPGTLDFGTIDPSSGGPALASTTFDMKCTNGTTSTAATSGNGLHFAGSTKNMLHPVTAGVLLPYSISFSGDTGFAGTGFSGGASNTVTISGTVLQTDFANALASAAAYTDTVVITVNP